MKPGDSALAERLRREVEGDVRFDAVSSGQYSTDASIYQIEPLGVVIPRSAADIEAVIGVAGEFGVPVLPRGAGTSQCGQTVGAAIVVDVSPHLDQIIYVDREARRVVHIEDLPSAGDTAFPSVVRTGDHTYLIANYTSPIDDPDRTWLQGQASPDGTQIYLIELRFEPAR